MYKNRKRYSIPRISKMKKINRRKPKTHLEPRRLYKRQQVKRNCKEQCKLKQMTKKEKLIVTFKVVHNQKQLPFSIKRSNQSHL